MHNEKQALTKLYFFAKFKVDSTVEFLLQRQQWQLVLTEQVAA